MKIPRCDREGRERKVGFIENTAMRHRRGGTGFLFEEPNPTGSRPSDLIGLYRKWQRTKRPQPGELGIGIQQLKRHARSAVAVVMVASSEQANAWRPGREEAVKAMGLVRGMVYSSRRETPTGEKELGTEFYSKNPTPNGSRPSDLIGLYKKWQSAKRPQPAKRSSREEGGATGAPLRRGQP